MATGTIHFEDRVLIPSNVFDIEGYSRWIRSDQFPDQGRIAFLDGEFRLTREHDPVVGFEYALEHKIFSKSR